MPVKPEANPIDEMQELEVNPNGLVTFGSVLCSFQVSRAPPTPMETSTAAKHLPAEYYDTFLTEKAKTRLPSASAFRVSPSSLLRYSFSQTI